MAPPHELGHCNGLHDYVIDKGISNIVDGTPETYNNSNVMGYPNIEHSFEKCDFYQWQIDTIRKNILERINSKK